MSEGYIRGKEFPEKSVTARCYAVPWFGLVMGVFTKSVREIIHHSWPLRRPMASSEDTAVTNR